MRGNVSRGTKPEIALRQAIWRRGLRYRLHRSDLAGKPDIAFVGLRIAIFCDGDFWHGRDWESRKERLKRGQNAGYWVAKIARNRERDREKERELTTAGWTVLRFWEGEINEDPEAAAELIEAAVAVAKDSRS